MHSFILTFQKNIVMKLQKELLNGFYIFLGIGIYFLIMEVAGLTHSYYLRILNIFIVLFITNKTIKTNIQEGKNDYLKNIISAGLTPLTGVVLSVIGLRVYIAFKGGDDYLKNLSDVFLFGNNPTVNEYCIGLLFEGIASAVIATFILMQYWRKYIVSD